MRTLLVCWVVVAGTPVLAQPEARVSAGVNWCGQVIRATGSGAPDVKASSPAQARLGAERAALLDAFRNLLGLVRGVAVEGNRRLGDLMEKDEIRAKVEGVVKGYKVIGKRYFSDNGVEVEVEVPLPMFADIVDPDPVQVAAVGGAKGNKAATGLVIDARGLRATPALLPRVLDDRGKAIYSVDSLSADARKSSGVASYVQSMEDAKKSMKAGEKPLVMKAAKVSGSDILLNSDDAKKLASFNTSFLADGRVVIVVN